MVRTPSTYEIFAHQKRSLQYASPPCGSYSISVFPRMFPSETETISAIGGAGYPFCSIGLR